MEVLRRSGKGLVTGEPCPGHVIGFDDSRTVGRTVGVGGGRRAVHGSGSVTRRDEKGLHVRRPESGSLETYSP